MIFYLHIVVEQHCNHFFSQIYFHRNTRSNQLHTLTTLLAVQFSAGVRSVRACKQSTLHDVGQPPKKGNQPETDAEVQRRGH